MNDTTVNGRVAPGQAGEPGVRDRRSGTPESRPQLKELRFGRVGDGAGRVPPAPLPGPAPPARRARHLRADATVAGSRKLNVGSSGGRGAPKNRRRCTVGRSGDRKNSGSTVRASHFTIGLLLP